jgi:hypothetical protein
MCKLLSLQILHNIYYIIYVRQYLKNVDALLQLHKFKFVQLSRLNEILVQYPLECKVCIQWN